jgi:hypothetical protein
MQKYLLFFYTGFLLATVSSSIAQTNNIKNKISDIRAKNRLQQEQKNKAAQKGNTLDVRGCPAVNIIKTTDTICGRDLGGSYTGQVVYIGASVKEWSSDGDGFFSAFTPTSFTYQYSVTEAGRGYVWLYVAVTDSMKKCNLSKDSLFLKLSDPARINLEDFGYFECGNNPIFLDGNISGTATTVYWTTSGTGYFSPNPSSTTFYHPSVQDRILGSVGISGTTNDPYGPCPAVSDVTGINFTDGVLFAGADSSLCVNAREGLFHVNAITYGNVNEITWRTNGTGSFINPNSFDTYYNYTAADVVRGNIKLYATSDLNPCGTFTDTLNLWLQATPGIQFTSKSLSACIRTPVVTAEVQLSGSATSGTWSTSGTGYFETPTALKTKYQASRMDIAQKCVTLKFTTNKTAGPCKSINASIKACFVECAAKYKAAALPENSVSLYPNPAKDFIIINTAQGVNKNLYTVTDIAGQLIPCKWIGNSSLDISRLKTGTYLLHIVTGKSKQTIRFIKL